MYAERFAERLPGIEGRRALATLRRSQGVNGSYTSRENHIERLIALGYQVTVKADRRRFSHPDGRFFEESDLTKIGLNFAEWLIQTGYGPPGEMPPCGTCGGKLRGGSCWTCEPPGP